MDLHANAALSLNKRRLLADRAIEQGWTLTKAAEAAEVSVRCARKWVNRYRAEGFTSEPFSSVIQTLR
jgi:transposase